MSKKEKSQATKKMSDASLLAWAYSVNIYLAHAVAQVEAESATVAVHYAERGEPDLCNAQLAGALRVYNALAELTNNMDIVDDEMMKRTGPLFAALSKRCKEIDGALGLPAPSPEARP